MEEKEESNESELSSEVRDSEVDCAKDYLDQLIKKTTGNKEIEVKESGEITMSEMRLAKSYLMGIYDNMIMKNKDEEDSNQGRFNEYKEGEDEESENESENDGENNPKDEMNKEHKPSNTILAVSSPKSKDENLKASIINSSKEESKSSIIYDKTIKQNMQNYISNQTDANSKIGFKVLNSEQTKSIFHDQKNIKKKGSNPNPKYAPKEKEVKLNDVSPIKATPTK